MQTGACFEETRTCNVVVLEAGCTQIPRVAAMPPKKRLLSGGVGGKQLGAAQREGQNGLQIANGSPDEARRARDSTAGSSEAGAGQQGLAWNGPGRLELAWNNKPDTGLELAWNWPGTT